MRAGEMITLTWEDIDFYHNKIRVNKSAKLINGSYVTTEPKTKNSIRYITMNNKIISLLKQWKDMQPDFLVKNFQNVNANDLLVFQYSENHPSSDYFYKQIITTLQKGGLH